MTRTTQAKAATHKVTPRDTFYEVVSGSSGKVYKVAPIGGEAAICDCEARTKCSHVLAVVEFARTLTTPQSLAMEFMFSRIAGEATK
jgi:hypothetical protein